MRTTASIAWVLSPLILIVLAADAFAAPPLYSLLDLDANHLPSAHINGVGQLVGRHPNGLGGGIAFVATPDGAGGYSLKDVPLPPGPSSYGEAINMSGQVSGFFGFSSLFMWKPDTNGNGTVIQLPDINPLGSVAAHANGINDSGSVVGYGSDGSTSHAFLWKPTTPNGTSGSVVSIGGEGAEPLAINNYGSAVGLKHVSGSLSSLPFFWHPDSLGGTTGQSVTLPGLPGGDGTGQANAINAVGQIVGTANNGTALGHAFLWSPAVPNGTTGSITDLGGTYLASQANAINASGTIVGKGVVSFDDARATMWSPADGLVDLNTRLIDGSAWKLYAAYDINDAGQIIAEGIYYPTGGQQFLRYVLLTPTVPEPAAALLWGTVLPFFARRSRSLGRGGMQRHHH